MDEGCGCLGYLIVGALGLGIVGLVLAVVASAFVAVLVAALIVGIIVGIFYTFKSFVLSSFEMKYSRRMDEQNPSYTDAQKNDEHGKKKYFETYGKKSYYNGRMLKSIGKFLGTAWSNTFNNISMMWNDFKLGSTTTRKVFFFVKFIFSSVSILIFGSAISAVLSVLIFTVALIIQILYYIFFIIFSSADKLAFAMKKVSYRCDGCKESYKFPVYICPECKVPHQLLRPGKFGLFHRRCACGKLLPCTTRGKTEDGIRRSDLPAICPKCGLEDKSKFSRPLGIALIGGVSAGKTTFKTAFLYKFINEDALRFGIDVQFPEGSDAEYEFEEIEKQFKGLRVVPATQRGTVYDVTSFNFFMKHQKFDVPRYLHIYDMPGEAFEEKDSKEKLRQFSFSEGVIFIIDPYSLSSVVNSAESMTGLNVSKMDIDTLVQVFLETLGSLPGMRKEGGKYTLPVAVAINKIDSARLKNLVGSAAIEKLQKAVPEVYKNKYDTMDYLCRSFLISNDKSNAVALLDTHFKNVHFFSCSSMGYVPKGALSRFTPENVVAAVQWILTRSDSKIRSVWEDESVKDITEAQKKVWEVHRNDYLQYIENGHDI